MAYPRTHVRQALLAAKEAGKDCTGLSVDKRETAIMLEKWGYLPVDQSAVDDRIQAWYVSQGLATRASDTPGNTPDRASEAAIAALEAALATAQACLTLARMAGGEGLSDRSVRTLTS